MSMLTKLVRTATVVALVGSASLAYAAPSPKGRVLLVGSSSVNDAFGDIVVEKLEREGYAVARHGYPSAGLSRPDFRNMHATLAQMPIGPSTSAVVLYLGGNDAQPLWLEPSERGRDGEAWVKWGEARWSEIYEKRVRHLIDATCTRGAQRVIVLPPVDVVGKRMQSKLERVRTLQEHAAASSKCGRAVRTTGDAADLQTEAKRLRGPEGVHMTHVGAARVWGRVGARLLSLIGAKG